MLHPLPESHPSLANTRMTPLRELILSELETIQKSQNSPLGRFALYWKGNPKMRIAVGLGLLSGGMLATATGALATASIILGARAGISALGAFTASKGIYEVIRGARSKGEIENLVLRTQRSHDIKELESDIVEIENRYPAISLETKLAQYKKERLRHERFANIIGTVAALTAGTLGLQRSFEVLIEGTGHLMPPNHVMHNAMAPNLGSPTMFHQNIDAIADDIRKDHPKQKWITLEQMIRRIEGGKIGIDLEHSEKLIPLNGSVSELVHNPNGPIAQILKLHGYDTGQGITAICRNLKENEIKNIAADYLEMTLQKITTNTEVVSQLTPQPDLTMASEVPGGKNFFDHSAPSIVGGIGLGGASILGYKFLSRHEKIREAAVSSEKKSEATEVASEHFSHAHTKATKIASEHFSHAHTTSSSASGNGVDRHFDTEKKTSTSEKLLKHRNQDNEIQEILTETIEGPARFELPESASRVRQKIHANFTNHYHWELDEASTITTEEKRVESYQGVTLGGSYLIYVTYTKNQAQVAMVWYDHNAARGHALSSPLSYDAILHPLEHAPTLESRLDEIYFEMLTKREIIKQEDMKHIHTIKVPGGFLRSMYEHMEQPSVRVRNLEVLGFWLASAYKIDNGVLPIDLVVNPPLEDQEIGPGHCRLKNRELSTQYYFLHPNILIRRTLPLKESEMILQKRQSEINDPENGVVVFTGASRLLNWHKHPDAMIRPSPGDISEAMRDLDVQYPGVHTYLYTIAHRITESEIEGLSQDPKVIVLPKSVYSGAHSYAFRSYNLIFEKNRYIGMQQLSLQLE